MTKMFLRAMTLKFADFRLTLSDFKSRGSLGKHITLPLQACDIIVIGDSIFLLL